MTWLWIIIGALVGLCVLTVYSCCAINSDRFDKKD